MDEIKLVKVAQGERSTYELLVKMPYCVHIFPLNDAQVEKGEMVDDYRIIRIRGIEGDSVLFFECSRDIPYVSVHTLEVNLLSDGIRVDEFWLPPKPELKLA